MIRAVLFVAELLLLIRLPRISTLNSCRDTGIAQAAIPATVAVGRPITSVRMASWSERPRRGAALAREPASAGVVPGWPEKNRSRSAVADPDRRARAAAGESRPQTPCARSARPRNAAPF